jgi:hypothetical protein
MRISSEMFPFASHAELGYTLEFAKPELSAAGRIAMKYGHRLTMHPVFSPREVRLSVLGPIHSDCVAEAKCRDGIDSGFRVPCGIT